MESDHNPQRDILLLTLVFLVFFALFFVPYNGTGSDPIFYYGTLTSFLFDGDVDLLNDVAGSANPAWVTSAQLGMLTPKGLINNQYAIGCALLWLPFALPVRAVAWVGGGLGLEQPWMSDRFAPPYLVAVSLGTVVYGYLTLLLIHAACRRPFGRAASLLAALGVVFASPLLAYIYVYPTMSHAPSAFGVALLLYLGFRYRDFPDWRAYVLLGTALGLATLVRWQNVLFGLLPLAFWLDHVVQRRGERALRREAAGVLAGAAAFAAIVSLQMFYWYAQHGSFLTIPQGESFMRWGAPAIVAVLFSGWHGLYYYHPLLLAATVGLLVYAARMRRSAVPFAAIACVALMIYVNAAVDSWWGGAAFGGRKFSSSLPLLALGLAACCSLFRGRWIAVPAVLTSVAILFNVCLLTAFARGTFDMYFWRELAELRGDILDVLPRWLLTIPLDSWAVSILLEGRHLVGLALLLCGLVLIGGLLLLVRRGGAAALDRHGLALAAGLLAFILALDLALFVRNPAPDEKGRLYGRVMNNERPVPAGEKRAAMRVLADAGYRNPDVYYRLAALPGEQTRRDELLEAARRVCPRFWAKWVSDLPEDEVAESSRTEARRLLAPAPPGTHDRFATRLAACRAHGDMRAEGALRERLLAADPFSAGALQRLMEIYRAEERPDDARRLKVRLRRFLRAKVESFLAAEPRVGHWDRYLFNDHYIHYTVLLAQYYEANRQIERAVEMYDLAETRAYDGAPYRHQRLRLALQREGASLNEAELQRALDDPTAPVDLLVRAAQLYSGRNDLARALGILQLGFQRHPEDQALSYWLRQVLQAWPVERLPLDALLAADLDSPEYWVVVAEYLNLAGRYDEAMRVLEAPLARRPKHAWTNFVYGCAAYARGDFARAEAAFRQSRAADPAYPTYSAYLGRALLGQGRADEALPIVREALERAPGDALLTSVLGELEAARKSPR